MLTIKQNKKIVYSRSLIGLTYNNYTLIDDLYSQNFISFIERVRSSKLYKIRICLRYNNKHITTKLVNHSTFLECKQYCYDIMQNMEDNRIKKTPGVKK